MLSWLLKLVILKVQGNQLQTFLHLYWMLKKHVILFSFKGSSSVGKDVQTLGGKACSEAYLQDDSFNLSLTKSITLGSYGESTNWKIHHEDRSRVGHGSRNREWLQTETEDDSKAGFNSLYFWLGAPRRELSLLWASLFLLCIFQKPNFSSPPPLCPQALPFIFLFSPKLLPPFLI